MNESETPAFGAEEEFEQRRREFDEWVKNVRDPATKATEGVRTIGSRKIHAEASYQIAPLPDGRFALKFSLEFHTGDTHGHGSPWQAYDTREECVEAFLEAARKHFRPRQGKGTQVEAQRHMLALLTDTGLFGFTEPEPVPFAIRRGVQEKLDALMQGGRHG